MTSLQRWFGQPWTKTAGPRPYSLLNSEFLGRPAPNLKGARRNGIADEILFLPYLKPE
jgi:hypothetical protein